MFGAMCPLPLRLGGSAEEGVGADQHARLSCDISASLRSAPLAVMLISVDGSGNTSIDQFLGCGSYDTSTVYAAFSGSLSIDLGNRYIDDDHRTNYSWSALAVIASIVSVGPVAATVSGNVITVPMSTGQSVVVVVYGSAEPRTCWDYGADIDKTHSTGESELPYAYLWLLDQQAQKGSAYSYDPGSLTYFEAVAKARLLGFAQRMSELYASQQIPATSDGNLTRWAEVMGISAGKPAYEIRNAASARMLLWSGCTDETLSAAVTRIMGAAFLGLYRSAGTLLSPPEPTYWPYGTIGPAYLALDSSGPWTSRRCHACVGLQQVAGETITVTFRKAEQELGEILANALPAVASYSWGLGPDAGFTLGVDRLGRDLL